MTQNGIPSVAVSNRLPACVHFRRAYALPTRIVWPAKGRRQGSITGCLYSQDFLKIELSERIGGKFGDLLPSLNPPSISPGEVRGAEVLPGTSLYLGHLMHHYGHCLIESLPNLAWARRLPNFDWLVLHPFAGTEALPAIFLKVLGVLQIPAGKVRVVSSPVVLEEVIVPERLFSFHHSANVQAREIYGLLRDTWSVSPAEHGSASSFYYLSRVNTSLTTGGSVIANEIFLEQEMLRLGVDVFYPEQMSFEEQVRNFAGARLLIGPGGSAMHNVVFSHPGGLLIEIGDGRSVGDFYPTQSLCNQLARWDGVHLPRTGVFLGRKSGREIVWLRTRRIREAIIREAAARGVVLPASRRGRRVGHAKSSRAFWLMIKSLVRAALGR